jgi:ABC-2 type transport system ATP-binding protein
MPTRLETADGDSGQSPHDAVIRTVELTKRYPGGVLAVDRLDLTIARGEIFGLLGPNGAGKSTSAGMLTGRVVPTAGRAFVDGVDVWRHPADAKRRIGVMPQSNTLDRSLDVFDNLYFHGRFFGMSARQARTEADELLQRFRLADRGRADVGALSGGMAQRLMVARAVMHRPAVLFLDEPTAGLDPQSRIAMWRILREMHVEGQTIMLTTHYMEEADQMCDRVAIIDRGVVLAKGSPSELKSSTGLDSVVTVTADGSLERVAEIMEAEVPGTTSVRIVDGAVHLGVSGAQGVLPHVVQAAERHGIVVSDVSVSVPSLETVFIDLTGSELRE